MARRVWGPDYSFSECTCPLLTFVFEFELGTSRAPQGAAPVQATKKVELKYLLRLQNAILVCSNYIPHTFNPFGDVTMSYLLWAAATATVRQSGGPPIPPFLLAQNPSSKRMAPTDNMQPKSDDAKRHHRLSKG